MAETAVGRYLQVLERAKHRPNKRIRKAAWREASALISEGLARDREALVAHRSDIKRRELESADRLYGADKFGRDVSQPLVIPRYRGYPPKEPEHGFRLIYVDGMPMRLWHEGEWVKLSGDLLRQVGSSGLRVALAQACSYQEMRKWASHQHALNFRDWVCSVQVEYEAWKMAQ